MPGNVNTAVANEHDTPIPIPIEVEVFQASCRLWTIFLAIPRWYYGPSSEEFLSGGNSLDFAENVYRQLLDWAATLPLSLVRRPESHHSILMLHIYFHAIVADVFRPFAQAKSPSPRLKTFGGDNATPKAVYSASCYQMKRLLLSYRLNFRLETCSVLWQTCIIYVANAAVRKIGTDPEELRFFVHLCLAGLEDLFASFKVFGSIAKGVLAMTIRQDILERDEVRRVCRELKRIGQRYDEFHDEKVAVLARWIVDLDLAMTDSVGAQGGSLAEQFEKMNLK